MLDDGLRLKLTLFFPFSELIDVLSHVLVQNALNLSFEEVESATLLTVVQL
jgi:hypothetical protein